VLINLPARQGMRCSPIIKESMTLQAPLSNKEWKGLLIVWLMGASQSLF